MSVADTSEADPAVGSAADMKPGTTVNNANLMTLFDVGLMGGMRRSVKRGHLVVVSDHTKSLYEDRYSRRRSSATKLSQST